MRDIGLPANENKIWVFQVDDYKIYSAPGREKFNYPVYNPSSTTPPTHPPPLPQKCFTKNYLQLITHLGCSGTFSIAHENNFPCNTNVHVSKISKVLCPSVVGVNKLPLWGQMSRDYNKLPLWGQRSRDYNKLLLWGQRSRDYNKLLLWGQRPRDYNKLPLWGQETTEL